MNHSDPSKHITIALVGHANVGKSVVFNFLTGLHQHIGNWPGKTVAKAEGTLYFHGYTIDVIDLPGVSSLTTFSTEELITREFIFEQKPDFIINVIDATNLERNLLLTLQLLELEAPMILAVNQVDLLAKKGLSLDYTKLSSLLNIPVVPTEAIYGKGLDVVLNKGFELMAAPKKSTVLNYGAEVEKEITDLSRVLSGSTLPYPERWLAIKLLEKDGQINSLIHDAEILTAAQAATARLEAIHGHDCSIIVAAERCHQVYELTTQVVKISCHHETNVSEKIDNIVCNKIMGYPILVGVIALIFTVIFTIGNITSTFLESFFPAIQSLYNGFLGNGFLANLGWAGVESFLGIITLVIPYIAPFYFILYLLENSGYLSRVAFLTDTLMHKLGIHGKACIPILLGYGCNVPACLSCKIMETYRERLISAILATSVPCSAITVIILGLVGKYMGIGWVLSLYFGNFLLILLLGKLLNKTLPGEPTELIMPVSDYRWPHFKTAAMQTWIKTKEFLLMAAPLIIIIGIIIQGLYLTGLLKIIVTFLSPITVQWLRLPEMVGVLLIFGLLRKELILILLATLLGSADFSSVLNHTQMLTLTVVSMLYIPCISTMIAFKHEFGWKKTLILSLGKIIAALFLGGLLARAMGLWPV